MLRLLRPFCRKIDEENHTAVQTRLDDHERRLSEQQLRLENLTKRVEVVARPWGSSSDN